MGLQKRAFFCIHLCHKRTPRNMAKKKKSVSSTTVWLIVAGAVVAGYFWLKKQLEYIQIGGVSVPFQKLDGTTVVLGLKVPVINGSAIQVRVTGFAGAIISPTGAIISTVYLSRPALVPRFQETPLEFMSYIRISDVATELYSILSSGKQPDWKGYKIKGQLLVYGIPVPIESSLV